MYCVKKMTEDLYWVGASERRLNLFENAYPLTNGVSYNSYLLLDEKTVLIDTVDKSVSGLFFENVDHVLSGRKLDYLIVQHMDCLLYTSCSFTWVSGERFRQDIALPSAFRIFWQPEEPG